MTFILQLICKNRLTSQIYDIFLDNWGDTAHAWVEITVPQGTKNFEGAVAPQILSSRTISIPIGQLYGGGNQIVVDGLVDSKWINKGVGGLKSLMH